MSRSSRLRLNYLHPFGYRPAVSYMRINNGVKVSNGVFCDGGSTALSNEWSSTQTYADNWDKRPLLLAVLIPAALNVVHSKQGREVTGRTMKSKFEEIAIEGRISLK